MALLFCDSFDHYGTGWTYVANKWTSSVSDTFGQTGIMAGRFGNGLRFSADSERIYKLLSAHDTWILGVAIYFTAQGKLMHLYDAGSSQLYVRLNSSALLTVVRGDGTVLGTGTTVLTSGLWYYVELKAVIHNSTGSAEVRLNDVVEINLTGVDTQATANASANGVGLGGTGGNFAGAGMNFDDFYALDGDDSGIGGAPNDNYFLGDVRVEAIFPSGNGNSSQLIGSDANSTDNYLLVDETTPDSDTTYVESDTVGEKDTYVFGNVTPTAGTVYGTQLIPFTRKTDAGVRKIVTVARLSATETDSAEHTLATTYQYLHDMREAKPGGGAWTISDVNSAEFGVKVST